MTNINDKLIQLAETKSNIKDAIISKGVAIDDTVPFGEYPEKIEQIKTGEIPTTKRYLNLINTTYQSPMEVEEAIYKDGYRGLRGIIRRATTSAGYKLQEVYTANTFNTEGKSWHISIRYKFDNPTSTGSKTVYVVNSTDHYKNLPLYRMKPDNTLSMGVGTGSGWLFDAGKNTMALQPQIWYRIKFGYDLPTRTYYINVYDDNEVLLDDSTKWEGYGSTNYGFNPVLLGTWNSDSENEDTNQYIDLDNTHFVVDSVELFERYL